MSEEQAPLSLTFDKPQFALLPDSQGARYYANVDNRMEILAGNANYYVAVAVPTGLFTLMKDVFKIPQSAGTVKLSIDQVQERYVFSLFYEGYADMLVDLWDYSRLSLPAWILDRGYRL